MLYYLLYFISCTHVFDFRGEDFIPNLVLYMKPFDKIEVKMSWSTMTVLSDLSKISDLYYDVDAGEPPDKIDKYGRYDRSSYIMGIKFKTKNYTIRFIYEGAESIKFGLIFCSNYQELVIPNDGLIYPFEKYENPFNTKDGPFLYDVGLQFHYSMFVGLGILCFLYVLCKCCCCFKTTV